MLNLGLSLSNFGKGLKIGLFSQIHKQNKLDEKIKAATSFFLLLASLLKMGCVYANSTYKIHNPNGIRLLTLNVQILNASVGYIIEQNRSTGLFF